MAEGRPIPALPETVVVAENDLLHLSQEGAGAGSNKRVLAKNGLVAAIHDFNTASYHGLNDFNGDVVGVLDDDTKRNFWFGSPLPAGKVLTLINNNDENKVVNMNGYSAPANEGYIIRPGMAIQFVSDGTRMAIKGDQYTVGPNSGASGWILHPVEMDQQARGAYSSEQTAMSGQLFDVSGHGFRTETPASSSFDEAFEGTDYYVASGINSDDGRLLVTDPTASKRTLWQGGDASEAAVVGTPPADIAWDASQNRWLGVTYLGEVLESTDNGVTWSTIYAAPGNGQGMISHFKIVVLGNGNIYIITESGSLFPMPGGWSNDGGVTFNAITGATGSIIGIGHDPVTDRALLLSTDQAGTIYLYDTDTGAAQNARSYSHLVSYVFSNLWTIGLSAGLVNGVHVQYVACSRNSPITERLIIKSDDLGALSLVDGTIAGETPDVLLASDAGKAYGTKVISWYTGLGDNDIWESDDADTWTSFANLASITGIASFVGLVQDPLTNAILAITKGTTTGDGNRIYAIDVEKDICNGDGTPIKIRKRNGRFDIFIANQAYTAGDTIAFGAPNFTVSDDSLDINVAKALNIKVGGNVVTSMDALGNRAYNGAAILPDLHPDYIYEFYPNQTVIMYDRDVVTNGLRVTSTNAYFKSSSLWTLMDDAKDGWAEWSSPTGSGRSYVFNGSADANFLGAPHIIFSQAPNGDENIKSGAVRTATL